MPYNLKLPGHQQGIALVIVLWIITLLSLLAATISTSSRSTGQQVNNLKLTSQAHHAQDAGLHWAYWGLLQPQDQASWLADGSVHSMFLGGVEINVAIEDEHGKIDLNRATEGMLKPLFIAAGVEDTKAESLTDTILDWRDTDNLKRLNGAEDPEYHLANVSFEAKDAPFESIWELNQVLGMDEELFNAIESSVTVYSGKALVNPLVAPKLVLMALSGLDEYQIDQFIEERRQSYDDGLPPSIGILHSRFFSTSLPGLNYTIHTQAVINSNIRSGTTVVVRRRGGKTQEQFQLLERRPINQGLL